MMKQTYIKSVLDMLDNCFIVQQNHYHIILYTVCSVCEKNLSFCFNSFLCVCVCVIGNI